MAGQLGTFFYRFLIKKIDESRYINFVPSLIFSLKSLPDGFVPRCLCSQKTLFPLFFRSQTAQLASFLVCLVSSLFCSQLVVPTLFCSQMSRQGYPYILKMNRQGLWKLKIAFLYLVRFQLYKTRQHSVFSTPVQFFIPKIINYFTLKILLQKYSQKIERLMESKIFILNLSRFPG